MNIVNGFLQRIKRGYLVESFLITQFLNKELAICIHRVFLNQVVFLGLPDLLAEFYPPVRQLEVDEDVVVGEGLSCPHALGDDVPGRSRAPVGDTEDIGAIFLLSKGVTGNHFNGKESTLLFSTAPT